MSLKISENRAPDPRTLAKIVSPIFLMSVPWISQFFGRQHATTQLLSSDAPITPIHRRPHYTLISPLKPWILTTPTTPTSTTTPRAPSLRPATNIIRMEKNRSGDLVWNLGWIDNLNPRYKSDECWIGIHLRDEDSPRNRIVELTDV